MRLALGGIWHETNSFVPTRTTLADFHAYQYASGAELIERYIESGTELGGVLAAAQAADVEIVPLSYAAALPSGPVEAEAFSALVDDLLSCVSRAGPIDGLMLVLHGAMVVEGLTDPEAEIVAALQLATGSPPTAVTLDLHANVSARLAELLDIVSIYRTYPHVDMAERGAEATRLLIRTIGEGRPVRVYLHKLPLITVPQVQETQEGSMSTAVEAVTSLLEDPRVWSASFAPGYPYSDVERLGFTLCAVADSDVRQLLADHAEKIWNARVSMFPDVVTVEEAVALAARGPWPTVLADVGDNVGGGSPGDGTILLRALRESGIEGALCVIWDPDAVNQLHATGCATTAIAVGGRATRALGEPLAIEGKIESLDNVSYRRAGNYMRGQVVRLGRVAIVHDRVGDVVLTEHRVMPFDRDHLAAVGLNPAGARVLIVKGATAWKEPFRCIAQQVVYVDTPGYCPSDLSRLVYTRRPRPLWPLDTLPSDFGALPASVDVSGRDVL